MLSVGLEGGSANSLADMLLSSAPQRLSTSSNLSGSWRSVIMETAHVIHKEHSFTQSTGQLRLGQNKAFTYITDNYWKYLV